MTGQTIQFQLGGTLKFLVEEPSKAGVFFEVTHDGFTIKARGDQMAYILATDHQVKVKVSYIDAKGHPAAVDGVVAWQSSNPAIVTVTADVEDSTVATIVPGADLGQAQVTATADADLGAGVTNLVTPMDIEIVGGQAVAGTISPVGEATPIA